MTRRLLLVPMHETTTAAECGACPMAQWPEVDGASWAHGAPVECGAFGGVVWEKPAEHPAPNRCLRVPACLAAEEVALRSRPPRRRGPSRRGRRLVARLRRR